MRAKKFGALFLAGTMMTGTIGIVSPEQVEAAFPANTYTMDVPADMNNLGAGWNELGSICVKGNTTMDRAVIVTVATEKDFQLKDGQGVEAIPYTLKTSEDSSASETKFTFGPSDINAEGGASQKIGVYVEDFSGKPAGAYTDTIIFTGKIKTADASAIAECTTLQINFTDSNYQHETTWSRTDDRFTGSAVKLTDTSTGTVIYELEGEETWNSPYYVNPVGVGDLLEDYTYAEYYQFSVDDAERGINYLFKIMVEDNLYQVMSSSSQYLIENVQIIVDGEDIMEALTENVTN